MDELKKYSVIYDSSLRLQVEEFPNAAKFIKLDSPQGHRIADLGLHRKDLIFAQQCLAEINNTTSEIMRSALWFSAVSHYMKCFGNSAARFQLDRNKIFKNDALGQEVFDFFKNLRNKHFIHDENSYTQGIPSAVLNKKDAPYKIERILSSSVVVVTLDQPSYANLLLLIESTLKWVTAEFYRLCAKLTTELEATPYDDLYNMPDALYDRPLVGDVGKKRER